MVPPLRYISTSVHSIATSEFCAMLLYCIVLHLLGSQAVKAKAKPGSKEYHGKIDFIYFYAYISFPLSSVLPVVKAILF